MPFSPITAPPQMNSQVPGSGSRLTGIKVLVVDDDIDSLELAAFILEMEGAEVRTAPRAIRALEVLEAFRPHLLISDITMPEVDGFTFIKQVRSHQELGQLPAIALTAHARVQDAVKFLQAGYQLHLVKPLDTEALVEAVATLADTRP